ncbi:MULTISPECIES: CshA/CshB family fibrillar adhesin-related protein [Mesonia]|uniref:Uncharacterized protein n=1 Tax=Mesonia oceanica TaxID=2687242 RepID=A0AC61YDQ8_9FLAO|nr:MULTISPECIES: CshA/CshB family fibrillar adhesin-related protein [Mesonia]MAN26414.1 hypothetical protein [Mesonia sp.]MAQ39554.1 hypothetical protein [Mesonia sp.]MBJ99143.1 hypothetical protein [Flavobacteriaceae bacterium]VVV02425.1 hypothetical protein FVB9532_03724 [Mesonia oceanica]|tara:strand:- start:13132 stop:14571 length:1440 start_codon:yes stop_codon:yes gene_type:complete
MNLFNKYIVGVFLFFTGYSSNYAQCYPGNIVTSTFATGGTGNYLDRIIWLTWGAQSSADIYGKEGEVLNNGETSYASIQLSQNKYFCLQATIDNINPSSSIESYIPGNFVGDSMDELYNIGGTGNNNQLVAGIINADGGDTATFTVSCQAFLDGNPIRIKGLVIADAESLASSEEIKVSSDGEWKVVEVRKNIGAGPYQINKSNIGGGLQRVRFFNGNDNNTAAITILSFNETAYDTEVNNYEINFDVEIKGAGLTAIALGLLVPELDRGDAPDTYGDVLHIIDKTTFSDDQVPVGTSVNLNADTYTPASEIPETNISYLGSVSPDKDLDEQYTIDALGDDNDGGNVNEEDALPANLKRFYYRNFNYVAGKTFEVEVPYTTIDDSYLQGWVDFNVNGVFEDGEGVVQALPAGIGTTTLSWVVPNDVVIRPTYMRLRLSDNYYGMLTPETTLLRGEVEDHRMYVVKPAMVNPFLPSVTKE